MLKSNCCPVFGSIAPGVTPAGNPPGPTGVIAGCPGVGPVSAGKGLVQFPAVPVYKINII